MTTGFDRHGLLRRRRALQLRQVDLAATLGVTQQAVGKWERGTARPDVDLLPELAAALGCDIGDLFTRTPATTP